jgi:hypothetical protein
MERELKLALYLAVLVVAVMWIWKAPHRPPAAAVKNGMPLAPGSIWARNGVSIATDGISSKTGIR